MTMIKCKECGKEISSDADKCPNCGKKVEKGNLFLKIFGILFILGCIGQLIDHNEPTSKTIYSQKIPENIIYQKISPKELERNLKENAARAQQQYQGAYVEFQGRLDIIDANGEYFTINSGGFISNFHCSITNEQQKNILISKNTGNIVHIKGKITRVGEIMGYYVDVIDLK